MVWAYSGIAICLVLGLILFIVGWRGRRLDNHPHCRRCRYDLSGHEEIAVCPECGRSLARARAIRQGLRRKRRVLLALGCLLLLLAGTGGGGLAWQRSTGYDWDRHKPVWWLHADAKRLGNPAVSEPALRELVRRLNNDDLSRGQVRQLVETALQMQQDESIAWPNWWGTLVQTGIAMDSVDRTQIEAYWRTAATKGSLELETRPRIRLGARVPVRLLLTQERVALTGSLLKWDASPYRHVTPRRVRIDGQEVAELPLHPTAAHMLGLPLAARQDGRLVYAGEIGRHTIEIDVDCYARLIALQEQYVAPDDDEPGRWFGPWPVTVTAEFEIIDASEMIVERVSLGPAPVAHTHLRKGNFELRTSSMNNVAHTKFGAVWLEEHDLGVSFDVIGRGTDREERLGRLAAPPSGYTLMSFERPLAEIFPNDALIQIVLRTNIQHAEERVDIDKVWDGEIVLKNVSTTLLEADPSPAEAARRGAPPVAHVRTDMGSFQVRAGNGIWSEFTIHGAVWLDDYPRPVSLDVIGRVGDREEVVGRIVAGANTPMMCQFEESLTSVFPEAETIDLVLRSNIKHGVAEGLPSELIWRGEIVINDVRIREALVEEPTNEGDGS